MPPRSTIWSADPHTLAKHRVLEKYLGAWMPTLGSYHGRVVFIDSFAGPGEYIGGEDGSPIIALKTYLTHTHRSKMTGEFVFVFTDAEADRIAYLRDTAIPRLGDLPPNVRVICEHARFDESMQEILDSVEKTGMAPTFAFLDPFGFSATPMGLIHRLLEHPRSEVFVTVMLEAVNRFLSSPSTKIAAHFDDLFGDSGWRDLIGTKKNRIDRLGDFYADQLRLRADYVWSFRMLDDGNRPIYDLFFATHHFGGLKKMKRAMWNVDPAEGGRFSDRSEDRPSLFGHEPDTSKLRDWLLRRYKGQVVSIGVLEKAVILETDFHDGHIKRRTLWPLEEEGFLEFVPNPYEDPERKRRKKTYPIGSGVKFLNG